MIIPVLITNICFLLTWDHWEEKIYLDFCIPNIQLPIYCGFIYFYMKISLFLCAAEYVSKLPERNIAIKCRWSFICKLKYILKRMKAYSCLKLVCSVRAVRCLWGLFLCCVFSCVLAVRYTAVPEKTSTYVGRGSRERWGNVSGLDLRGIKNP